MNCCYSNSILSLQLPSITVTALYFICAGRTWSCSLSATTTKTVRWTRTGRHLSKSASTPRRSQSSGETTRPPTNPCTWNMYASLEGTRSRSQSLPAAVWVHTFPELMKKINRFIQIHSSQMQKVSHQMIFNAKSKKITKGICHVSFFLHNWSNSKEWIKQIHLRMSLIVT